MTTQEKEKLISQLTVFINSIPDDAAVEGKATAEPTPSKKVELLTIKECIQVIDGLSECTVRQYVAQGKLTHIRTGAGKRGKILIPKASLLKCFGG